LNFSIVRRLQILVAVAIAGLLILATSGYWVAAHLRDGLRDFDANTIPSIEIMSDLNESLYQARIDILYHVFSEEDAKKTELERSYHQKRDAIQQLLETYEKQFNHGDTKGQEIFATLKSSFNDYFTVADHILEKSNAHDAQGAQEVMRQGGETITKLADTLIAHRTYSKEHAQAAIEEAKATDLQGEIIALALVIVCTTGIAGLGLFLIRNISKALNTMRDTVGQIETTLNFTQRIDIHSHDELGTAAQAINQLLGKMQNNLKIIAHHSHEVASAAAQMAAASSQVSTASVQQSEAASNMAATVEEMAVSVNHVADRAQEANLLSSESGQLAVSGEVVIGQTTQDINDIAATIHAAADRIQGLEKQGEEIASVVQVIKEVADQTNLLALNAAIEAARAGEQGRGFAVVADEVRKLAERTAASTLEITRTIDAMQVSANNAVDQIQGAVDKVSIGVAHASDANDSIQRIGKGSRNTVAMVEEIANAIREQGVATNSIGSQVEKIAQMSEESSAAAIQSASVAQKLDSLASEMSRIVSAYRL